MDGDRVSLKKPDLQKGSLQVSDQLAGQVTVTLARAHQRNCRRTSSPAPIKAPRSA